MIQIQFVEEWSCLGYRFCMRCARLGPPLEWKAGTALTTTGTYLRDLRTHLLHWQRSTSTASFHFAGLDVVLQSITAAKHKDARLCLAVLQEMHGDPICPPLLKSLLEAQGVKGEKGEGEGAEGGLRGQTGQQMSSAQERLRASMASGNVTSQSPQGVFRRIFGFWAKNSNDVSNECRRKLIIKCSALSAACSIIYLSSFSSVDACSSPPWPGLGHHEPQGQGSLGEGQHSFIPRTACAGSREHMRTIQKQQIGKLRQSF